MIVWENIGLECGDDPGHPINLARFDLDAVHAKREQQACSAVAYIDTDQHSDRVTEKWDCKTYANAAWGKMMWRTAASS